MKLTAWKTTTAASAFAVLLGATIAACSSDDSTPSNTGGSAGTGGTATGGNAGTGGTAGTGGGATGGAAGTGGTISDSGSGADACVCSGAACTSAGVLFNFDAGGDAGATTGWSTFAEDSADSGLMAGTMLGSSTDQGHSNMTSLMVTVPFSAFGAAVKVSVQHNYGDSIGRGALDWSCKTKLHFWVKLVGPEDGGSITSFINGVQGFVQSGDAPNDAGFNGYTHYTPSNFATASTLADGMFHEVIIDLTTGTTPGNTPNPADINQIGVQVLALTAPVDGGPAAPSTVRLYIDDITLE